MSEPTTDILLPIAREAFRVRDEADFTTTAGAFAYGYADGKLMAIAAALGLATVGALRVIAGAPLPGEVA